MHVSNYSKHKDHHQAPVKQSLQRFESLRGTNSLLHPAHTHDVCPLPLASFLFEGRVEDKPVQTQMPATSVELSLSSLMGILKHAQPTKQACQHTSQTGKKAYPWIHIEQRTGEDADCQGENSTANHHQQKRWLPHMQSEIILDSPQQAVLLILVMGDTGVYLQYYESWCVLMNMQKHEYALLRRGCGPICHL